MVTAEGVFPKQGGDPPYASEYNDAHPWKIVNHITGTSDVTALLAHSATAWTAINGTTTKITSDSGVTWVDASADIADMTGVSRISKANGALAISCDHDSGNVSITSDSGDNWASASTDPAGITNVLDISFPTATVAVAGCVKGGAARGIFFSTDAGDNWTICTSGPAADVQAVDMTDGSNGMAIASDGGIWTTADGGDNWSDTTFITGAPTVAGSMIATSSTTGIVNVANLSSIRTFATDSDANTVRLAYGSAGNNYLSNLVKTTNGNIYFVNYNFAGSGVGVNIVLYKSEDSGVTWESHSLGSNFYSSITNLTTPDTKSQLVEYDTNKLLFLIGVVQLMKFDA